MASTKKAFYIVDLIRKRQEFATLDIPPIRIDIVIEVEAEVPTAKMERLEKAAYAKLEEFERIITEDCRKFDKNVSELLKQRKFNEAQKAANDANTTVRNALQHAEAAAMKAVEEAKKNEAQGDKLLLEARVKTVIKFTFGAVKIATSAVRIGGSHGADAHAWASLLKDLVLLGMDIHQLLKDEPKLRADLQAGIHAYLKFRNLALVEAAEKKGYKGLKSPGFPKAIFFAAQAVVGKGKEANAKNMTVELTKYVKVKIQVKINDVEQAREMYRNETFRLREKVDKVSEKNDKLFAAMKDAKDLTEGVKIGALCMQLKRKVTRLTEDLTKAQTFLKESDSIMQNSGLEIDDETILQKVKKLDIDTIFREGSDLADNISAINDLASALAAVA